MLQEDAVTVFRTHARLCFVILILGMRQCVSNSYGKLEDKQVDKSAVSVHGYTLFVKGTVLCEVIPSASWDTCLCYFLFVP